MHPEECREYSGYEILMAHYHDKGCNNLDRKLNKRHPAFYLQFWDCICNLFLQEKETASKRLKHNRKRESTKLGETKGMSECAHTRTLCVCVCVCIFSVYVHIRQE